MGNLTWGDVVIIGAVATVGFTLLSYWFSGIMSRRGWSWQIKGKSKTKELATGNEPNDTQG